MQGDASTLPFQGTATRPVETGGARLRGRSLAGADRATRMGAAALSAIVGLSLLIVLIAANRPSLLTPTTRAGYFPRWMAGPLGGLLQGFTNDGTTLRWLVTGAVIAMYGSYLLVLRNAARLPARWVLGAIVAVHATFLLSPPLSLTDLFNYVNYGRMEVIYHLNPYTTIPILEPHGDPAFLLSNWHELLSPYGPLFTLITFAVVPFGVAGSFWALKAILMAASLGTVALVWHSARLLGRDRVAAVALVGLNPIVLMWGLGGDHNDFLMMFFIVLAFYLLLRARGRSGSEDRPGDSWKAPAGGEGRAGWWAWTRTLVLPLSPLGIGAGTALVTAVAIKASAAVLVPVALAGVARSPRRLAQALMGLALGGVVLGGASLLAFGLHLPDLSSQSQLVTSESIPNLLGLLLGLGGESAGLRVAMDGALFASVLWCCALVLRGGGAGLLRGRGGAPATAGAGLAQRDEARAVTAAGWASIALLVTLSWVLPWYVLWVLPLAALSHSRRLRTAALAFGAYLILVWVPAASTVLHALHFHPEKTTLGRVHQRYTKELLD